MLSGVEWYPGWHGFVQKQEISMILAARIQKPEKKKKKKQENLIGYKLEFIQNFYSFLLEDVC